MAWSGEFVFGDVWAAYRGPAAANTPHVHVALQLAFASPHEIVVKLDGGVEVRDRAVIIRPAVRHAITASGEVGLIYVVPQAPLARALMETTRGAGAEPLDPRLSAALDVNAPAEHWAEALARLSPRPSVALDPRLAEVLRWLSAHPGESVAAAAQRSGLSASHLRSLTRTQLGVPLGTWLVWRKLERAARELAAGAGLAEAAHAAGFADQAHCTRTMRRMFGVTLGAARLTLG